MSRPPQHRSAPPCDDDLTQPPSEQPSGLPNAVQHNQRTLGLTLLLLVALTSRDVRGQTEVQAGQAIPQGPLANDENATPTPKANADTSEPGTSAEVQNQPYRKWIDTQRETTVVEQIDHCIALAEPTRDLIADSPADVSRRERGAKCYRAAVDLLDKASPISCASGAKQRRRPAPRRVRMKCHPTQKPARPCVVKAKALRKAMLAATKDNVDDLPRQIREMRAQFSRIMARHQGGATLVSQGGVSLGSWQAGLLYFVTEWEKQRAKRRFQEQDQAARASGLLPTPTPFRTAAFRDGDRRIRWCCQWSSRCRGKLSLARLVSTCPQRKPVLPGVD